MNHLYRDKSPGDMGGRTAHDARAVKVRKIPYAPYVEQWPVIMPCEAGDDAEDRNEGDKEL